MALQICKVCGAAGSDLHDTNTVCHDGVNLDAATMFVSLFVKLNYYNIDKELEKIKTQQLEVRQEALPAETPIDTVGDISIGDYDSLVYSVFNYAERHTERKREIKTAIPRSASLDWLNRLKYQIDQITFLLAIKRDLQMANDLSAVYRWVYKTCDNVLQFAELHNTLLLSAVPGDRAPSFYIPNMGHDSYHIEGLASMYAGYRKAEFHRALCGVSEQFPVINLSESRVQVSLLDTHLLRVQMPSYSAVVELRTYFNLGKFVIIVSDMVDNSVYIVLAIKTSRITGYKGRMGTLRDEEYVFLPFSYEDCRCLFTLVRLPYF